MSERDREPSGDEELTDEESARLAAWTVPDPPAGFADRVVAARGDVAAHEFPSHRTRDLGKRGPPAEPEPAGLATPPAARLGRRRVLPWAVVAAAALLALFLSQMRSPARPGGGSGSAAPATRQSIPIGRRAVAVAEAGAVLHWEIEAARARVSQRAGDVFYRVERGIRFEVDTPHGTVRVTGTCFRVELNPMKTPWQGVVGAAMGAIVVVTVYEGSVLFAGRDGGEWAVSAGQMLSSGKGVTQVVDRRAPASAVAGATAPMPEPPEASASRDDLLRRDAVQRAEIATLRARVRDLESGPGPDVVMSTPGEADASGRPWFDPSKEDLARFAAECRVRIDTPPFLASEPFEFGPRHPAASSMTAEERAAANRVLGELQRQFTAELRALYIEATGDPARADDLAPQAMASDLIDKAPEGELLRINQRIAQERAGLAAPPADPTHLSPLERYMRRQAALGDEVERVLAGVLGAQRARALRERQGGWDSRAETAGCAERARGDEEERAADR